MRRIIPFPQQSRGGIHLNSTFICILLLVFIYSINKTSIMFHSHNSYILSTFLSKSHPSHVKTEQYVRIDNNLRSNSHLGLTKSIPKHTYTHPTISITYYPPQSKNKCSILGFGQPSYPFAIDVFTASRVTCVFLIILGHFSSGLAPSYLILCTSLENSVTIRAYGSSVSIVSIVGRVPNQSIDHSFEAPQTRKTT